MAEFIQLTDPKGGPIWIGAAWIQVVEKPLNRHVVEGTNALIVLSGEVRGVQETVEQVRKKLNG